MSFAKRCVPGAALVGVGLVSVGVAVSPVAAPTLNPRVSAQAYTLTASSALLNVPVNMLNMVLSMPAWEIQAMNRLADAMIGTGSWQVWGPTNVFGFDEWDPPKLAGVLDMMMPVQPFSSVLGDQVNWWAKANFPMNAGCAAAPGACPDFGALLNNTLKVPLSKLTTGYQFPAVTNPFTLQPTSWSGQTVKLDPGAAFSSLWNYLTSEPTGVQTAPIGDYFTIPFKLAKSVFDAFYPFVQNSEWFNPRTPFSWAFRALAPLTCPSCGPEPYDNPWLNENYPPKPAATRGPAPAATVAAVAAPVAPPASRPVVQVDVPSAPTPPAVQVDAPRAPTPPVGIDEPAPGADPGATTITAGTPRGTLPDEAAATADVPAPSAADPGSIGHRAAAAGDHPSAVGQGHRGRARHSDQA